jgi:hypothetical protein
MMLQLPDFGPDAGSIVEVGLRVKKGVTPAIRHPGFPWAAARGKLALLRVGSGLGDAEENLGAG